MFANDQHLHERGQILVIFTLSIVAIMAMVGLVLDGGSTFVQRRDMQNVADSAAMAAAYAYANTASLPAAYVAASGVASKNGYVPGTNGVVLSVTPVTGAAGAMTFKVDLGKPHPNTFAGVVGVSSWGVSTTASAITGAPNEASGAMPLIFNQDVMTHVPAFGPDSDRAFDEPGTGTEDVPQGDAQFNWTVFCIAQGNPCNANTRTVDDLIKGVAPEEDTVITVGEPIGPLNAGSHTALFDDLMAHVGEEYPVGIVDNDGGLIGVATFHITGSMGGSSKQIRGYFVGPVNPDDMRINGTAIEGSSQWGSYVVKLVN